MTTSQHTKVLKQIGKKPGTHAKYLKHNVPKARAFGAQTHRCKLCGNMRGHIGRYGLHLCRRCFRQYATQLGFKKYS